MIGYSEEQRVECGRAPAHLDHSWSNSVAIVSMVNEYTFHSMDLSKMDENLVKQPYYCCVLRVRFDLLSTRRRVVSVGNVVYCTELR
jgi:hypothetical protein